MLIRRACVLLAALLAACATTMRNYSDPAGPRYTGAVPVLTPEHDTLRVVTFNVKFAEHVNRAVALIRATRALRQPDVLLLQEMDEDGARTIAAQLGLGYVYYPATLHPATHRDFGNAILSRYPISDYRKIVLPHLAWPNRTERAAVGATIHVGRHRIRVYSVHLATMLANSPQSRREQLAAVLADARPYALVVMGGDFNSGALPGIALRRGYEWPTHHLGRTEAFWDMDHVLLKGLEVPADSAAGIVHDVHGASDHRPVWAHVVVPTGDRGS